MSVGLVGRSVCHNFLKGQEGGYVILPMLLSGAFVRNTEKKAFYVLLKWSLIFFLLEVESAYFQ